ncbi:hypothetical protein Scel_76920 [Streptomyces cellostaticus]|nr:hypothetical protein Scel_76920 [Streptomyces cellostaticus]
MAEDHARAAQPGYPVQTGRRRDPHLSGDTLIQHPASISHRIVDADDRRGAGVSDRLLRLSVGLEDVDDLWMDLDQALGERTRTPVRLHEAATLRESAG